MIEKVCVCLLKSEEPSESEHENENDRKNMRAKCVIKKNDGQEIIFDSLFPIDNGYCKSYDIDIIIGMQHECVIAPTCQRPLIIIGS